MFRSKPFVIGHLRTTQRVAQGEWFHPNELHVLLCKGTDFQNLGGVYRSDSGLVIGRTLPQPQYISTLIGQWWQMVMSFREDLPNQPLGERERICRILHEDFLCIHPYKEQNGTLARLIYNMLGLHVGIGWKIFDPRNFQQYLWDLAEYEQKTFRPENRKFYPQQAKAERA